MPEKKSKLVEIKTKPTAASVEDFINAIKDEQKRKDSFVVNQTLVFQIKFCGKSPALWVAAKRYEH